MANYAGGTHVLTNLNGWRMKTYETILDEQVYEMW